MSSLRHFAHGLVAAVVLATPLRASFENLPQAIGTAALPRDPIPADVDGDGDLDVLYFDGGDTRPNSAEIGWFENADGTGHSWTRHVIAGSLKSVESLKQVDLDRDGIPDLLAAFRTEFKVVWLKGLPGGNFAAPATIRGSMFSIEEVNVADLNRDSRPDIIVSTSNGPAWLRQQAGFTFAAPQPIASYAGSAENQTTRALDFDHDGDVDVVSAIPDWDQIIFSRNGGSGNFAAAQVLESGARDPYALDAGDLDGDGWEDVVAATRDSENSRVFWFKNNRNGTFSAKKVLTSTSRDFVTTAIADLDRDGDADIIATGGGPLIWFENLGDGNFSAQKIISEEGDTIFNIVTGDIDHDGDPDLIASQWSAGRFVWYRNTTPDPAMTAPAIASFTADDTSVASQATLRWQTSGATSVEISPDPGAVAASGSATLILDATRTFTLTARNAGGVSSAELTIVVGAPPIIRSFTALDDTIARNARGDLAWIVDGAQELALDPAPGAVTGTSYRPLITGTTTFTLRARNEFGESSAQQTITAGSPPSLFQVRATPASIALNRVSTLSWNSNGATGVSVSEVGEVAVGNSIAVQPATTRTYTVTARNDFGQVSGTATVTVSGTMLSTSRQQIGGFQDGLSDIQLADIDGDGDDDLLTLARASRSSLQWLSRTGPGTFGAAQLIARNDLNMIYVDAYDIDGDGDIDPITSGDPMQWYPNRDGGGFGAASTIVPSFGPPRPFIGDLNGDGFTDIAGEFSSILQVTYGTAPGVFGPLVKISDFAGKTEFVESSGADIDGDGDIDLVAGMDFDGPISWFENVEGRFVNRHPVMPGFERLIRLTTGDTDNDGDPDILILATTTGLDLMVNPGKGDFSGVTSRSIPISGQVKDFRLVDFDLDGDSDIIAIGANITFLENRGSNNFQTKETIAINGSSDYGTMAVGDVDDDGDPDLLVLDDRQHYIWLYQNLFTRHQAPRVDPAVSLVALEEDFGEYRLPLAGLASDADTPASQLQWTINSPPAAEVLAAATLDAASGELVLSSAADVNGTTALTLRVTDPNGLFAQARVDITVGAVPDAPRPQAPAPTLTANATADPLVFEAASLFTDPDAGDVLSYGLSGDATPGILTGAILDPVTGRLTLTFAPYVSGEATLKIQATDSFGLSADIEVPVVLPALPPPTLAVDGEIALNRQTGLFEQRLTVTNGAARDIGGFHLDIANLPAGVILRNATGTGGAIDYLTPLAAGESISLVLEYYSPRRGTEPTPIITAIPVLPQAPPTATVAGLAVTRTERLADGGFLVEFIAEPGARYEIQYSPDSLIWLVSPVMVQAAGNRVQWIDRGPPHTDSPPANSPSRFYRVRQLEGDR